MALTRVQTILLRARDTLADADKERWSEDRLLRLIDEGQLDIAKHTRILKGEADIEPIQGKAVYDLPPSVWMLTRAAFEGCMIPFHSHDELDELVRTRVVNQTELYYTRRGTNTKDFSFANFCWELEEGTDIEALIYDRRSMEQIRVFPIPVTDDDSFPISGSGFGVIDQIEGYTFDTIFGVVTDIAETIDDRLIHIWYIKTPTTITLDTDVLEIPTMWDVALKHYIIANAFDDDMDTRFQEKAGKALALYERELGVMKKTDSLDGVRKSQYRTDYRGAFE